MLALAPPTQPGQQPPPVWTSLVPLVLLVVVFYFALIRPQQRKSKEHAQLLKTIRRGDEVITSSGLVGEVINVKEHTVMVRSGDAKLEVTKAAIAQISKRGDESSEAR